MKFPLVNTTFTKDVRCEDLEICANICISECFFVSLQTKTNKFIVFVGQWAKDIEQELTELIEKEFALPYFEFLYDEHWDLGHGWSGDL